MSLCFFIIMPPAIESIAWKAFWNSLKPIFKVELQKFYKMVYPNFVYLKCLTRIVVIYYFIYFAY